MTDDEHRICYDCFVELDLAAAEEEEMRVNLYLPKPSPDKPLPGASSEGNRDTFFQLEKGNRRLGRICRHCWPNDCGCFL